MKTFEVTVGEFAEFVDATNAEEAKNDSPAWHGDPHTMLFLEKLSRYDWKNTRMPQDSTNPVVNVSYSDATRFCQWLTERTRVVHELPTEAQWEFRRKEAGQPVNYETGDRTEGANYADLSYFRVKPDFKWRILEWMMDSLRLFLWAISKRTNWAGLTCVGMSAK